MGVGLGVGVGCCFSLRFWSIRFATVNIRLIRSLICIFLGLSRLYCYGLPLFAPKYRMKSPPIWTIPTWENLRGRGGWAVIRNGVVIGQLVGIMS